MGFSTTGDSIGCSSSPPNSFAGVVESHRDIPQSDRVSARSWRMMKSADDNTIVGHFSTHQIGPEKGQAIDESAGALLEYPKFYSHGYSKANLNLNLVP